MKVKVSILAGLIVAEVSALWFGGWLMYDKLMLSQQWTPVEFQNLLFTLMACIAIVACFGVLKFMRPSSEADPLEQQLATKSAKTGATIPPKMIEAFNQLREELTGQMSELIEKLSNVKVLNRFADLKGKDQTDPVAELKTELAELHNGQMVLDDKLDKMFERLDAIEKGQQPVLFAPPQPEPQSQEKQE